MEEAAESLLQEVRADRKTIDEKGDFSSDEAKMKVLKIYTEAEEALDNLLIKYSNKR